MFQDTVFREVCIRNSNTQSEKFNENENSFESISDILIIKVKQLQENNTNN